MLIRKIIVRFLLSLLKGYKLCLYIVELGLQPMRRSKLEIHIDILRALAYHGRLKPTHITYKANVNCSALKECLDFLVQRNLIKEQTINKKRQKRRVYAITDLGLTALRNVKEIDKALHVFDEPNVLGIEFPYENQRTPF
jgi:predicted transcriptional regulator